jgi:quinol monooxygenase YgiN
LTVLSFERFPVEPRQLEPFEAHVRRLLEAMREASGNLWADAARAFDDEPSYIVASEWRSEADVDAWDGCDAAAGFGEATYPLLRGEATHRRFKDPG